VLGPTVPFPAQRANAKAKIPVRDRFAGTIGKNTIADVELVVCELVTNAFDHGRGTIRLELVHDDDELHGSVCDDGEGFAYTKRTVGDDELGGTWARDGPRSTPGVACWHG